jgi:drug/metabolite transporter (DMT)-like permease
MIYVKLIATSFIWGGVFVVSRAMVQDVNPVLLAFYRFLFASMALSTMTIMSEEGFPKLSLKQILGVLFLGLTGIFGYNILLFSGLQTVTASKASFIIALNPITIALFSSIFMKDSLSRVKIFGMIMALSGASIIIFQSSNANDLAVAQRFSFGELLLIGCLFCWTFYTLLGKVSMNKISPLAATTYSCISGTFFLFIFSLFFGLFQGTSKISQGGWIGIIYMGVIATSIGFKWYYEGIQRIGTSQGSIFINLVPLSSVILSIIFLGEPISAPLFIGGILIVSGVTITNKL